MDACKFIFSALAALVFTGASFAGCDLEIDDLEDLVGYEIEDVKTIAGWVDEGEGKVGNADDWEGCRYNRKIIFEDGSTVMCSTYNHASAWGEQKAVIFIKYSDTKICVADKLMDVRGW